MRASKILGIEILNEGSGISVDDAVTEPQATFVARGIEPLQAVTSPYNQVSSSFLKQKPSRAREGETQTISTPLAPGKSLAGARETIPLTLIPSVSG